MIAFRDGQPVSMFIGAIPQPEIDRFLDAIVPSEAETEAKQAAEELAAGAVDDAEAGFREALEKDPTNRDAAIGLARILVQRGEFDEAEPLVTPQLPDPEAEHLRAAIDVARWRDLPADGRLGDARLAAANGAWREALDGMLAALTEDRDQARATLVTAFAALGDEDPLVPEYRRKLAAALF